ncbi:40S ribosomal protein S27 [Serendipita sp. 407]|nr:40S ribosomal protein S27 [Serendipita sp. 407]
MTLAVDLLNPSLESEKSRHKLKRLVQSPNSYFMDVKCPGQSPEHIIGPDADYSIIDA